MLEWVLDSEQVFVDTVQCGIKLKVGCEMLYYNNNIVRLFMISIKCTKSSHRLRQSAHVAVLLVLITM